MSFKFSLADHSTIIYHWMLQDCDTAEKISMTPDWVNSKNLTARVTVNGIEMDFAIVERYFQEIYRSLESEVREQYKDIEAEIERRLKVRLEKEAQPILDKMFELQRALEDVGDVIKPYWEKD